MARVAGGEAERRMPETMRPRTLAPSESTMPPARIRVRCFFRIRRRAVRSGVARAARKAFPSS